MTRIHIATSGGLMGDGVEFIDRKDTILYHRAVLKIGSLPMEHGPEVGEIPSRLLAMGLSEKEVKPLFQQLIDNKQLSFESPRNEQQAREILTTPLVSSAS
jgi:hypothetical protein